MFLATKEILSIAGRTQAQMMGVNIIIRRICSFIYKFRRVRDVGRGTFELTSYALRDR